MQSPIRASQAEGRISFWRYSLPAPPATRFENRCCDAFWQAKVPLGADAWSHSCLTREVIERLAARGAVLRKGPEYASRLNTEELKVELDELIVENRVEPFLHTVYCAPVLEENRLSAVIVENKSGRQAIRGAQFVDATGDGDLARDLGLPLQDAGPLQPPTMCAKIRGFGSLGAFDWQAAVREHGRDFRLPEDWGWGGAVPGLPATQLRADNHLFGTDAADAAQLTKAEIEGRRRVRAILDIVRKYGPADGALALVDLPATVGIRETRRIAARYRLTGADVLAGRRFADAIANGTYPVDIHHADMAGVTFRLLDGSEEVIEGRGAPPKMGRWRDPVPQDPTFWQIPLRCLVQDQVPNLILAGRMIDADSTAFGAVRVMVSTNQTGEAAGVACAAAVRAGCDVAAVDATTVRRLLADGGSIVI